jgi:hypothetical protein
MMPPANLGILCASVRRAHAKWMRCKSARHHLRYLDPVDDLDGLSGAPVFQVNEAEGNYSTESIAGMILRGTRASMTAYFLEHRRIIELLTEIEEGRVDDALHPPR